MTSPNPMALDGPMMSPDQSAAAGEGLEPDWQEDPAADERWNAGCDFAILQLCALLGVDPKSFAWDAATETVDGDVRAVIGRIFCLRYGEDFDFRAAFKEKT